MSNTTTPPGWYPDQEGKQRYWDGSSWTEHLAGATAGNPATGIVADATTSHTQKPPWWRRTWVIAVAVGLVAFGIGAASGSTDPQSTTEYKELAKKLTSANSRVAAKDADLAKTKSDLEQLAGTLPAREAAVAKKEADLKAREASQTAALKQREAAVAAKEKSVSKREKAVGVIEKDIAANTISDGTYEVGVDIKAGKYKTKGSGDACYWARLTSPGGDIKANNLVSGPSVVTVSKGEYLELNCDGAEWTLQR